MNHINKIEFSPELEPMLRVFAKKVEADTAILYRFIDIENVVATELLGLLSKSDMVNSNPDFYTDVIKENLNKKKGNKWCLKTIIGSFNNGTLDYEKYKDFLCYLKVNIRILRFAEYAEKDVDKKIYDFDYTERPQKYLVFSDEILQDKYQKKKPQYKAEEKHEDREFIKSDETDKINQCVTNQIKYEGITAYFVRAEDTAYFEANNGDRIKMDKEFVPKTILDANDAHVKNKANKPAYRIYGAHSAAWVLLKRKNDKTKITEVIGCLRYEFSLSITNKKDIEKIKNQLQLTFNDITIELFICTVDEVFENYEEFSYSKLYSCLDPIIRELIEIGKLLNEKIACLQDKLTNIENSKYSDEAEKKRIFELKKEYERLKAIHSTIEHLFFVFKRNTYYGEKIFLRVNHFIKDLLKKLDLPYEVYIKVWDSLKKQEELMLYDLHNYRDHFMHQFHVFIIGYIFIYRYGLEKLQKLTSNNYLTNGVLDGENKGKTPESFKRIDILRIWALTSLFHDCGYSFEKLKNGFQTFTKRTLRADLQIDATWEKFFLKEKTITMKLQTMAGFFKFCPNKNLSFDKTDVLRILLQKGILDNDHGIISALILLQHFDYSNLQEIANIGNLPEESVKLYYLTNIAAISIAIHNKVYREMMDQGSSQICFELNPFLFILVYCDTVQEWGRRKSNSENCQVYIPELTEIELKDKSNNDIFSVGLKYTVSKSEVGTIESNILKYVNRVSHVFVAPQKRSMKIKYKIGDRDSFEVVFANCNLNCQNCVAIEQNECKEKHIPNE